MTTLLITHPSSLSHETPAGHPERIERIRAVEDILAGEDFAHLVRVQAPVAEDAAILRVHSASHLAGLRAAAPREGMVRIDEDTIMSPGTLSAALHGAGGAVLAADKVMQGSVRNAFVAMRPPGHHAEIEKAMGFCFFNNAAIAARQAQTIHGAKRVAIFDWDVHHGNGTQDIFWNDPTVLYASTHQMPLYPGTGAAHEKGAHDNILNIPLNEGDGGDVFRSVLGSHILPRFEAFAPDLIILSAGFDAHRRDPLGGLAFDESDFAFATSECSRLAARLCEGRIVSILEGGYDLQGLAHSAAAHVKALMQG